MPICLPLADTNANIKRMKEKFFSAKIDHQSRLDKMRLLDTPFFTCFVGVVYRFPESYPFEEEEVAEVAVVSVVQYS